MVVRKLEIPPPISVALNSIRSFSFVLVGGSPRSDNNFPVGCSSCLRAATHACTKCTLHVSLGNGRSLPLRNVCEPRRDSPPASAGKWKKGRKEGRKERTNERKGRIITEPAFEAGSAWLRHTRKTFHQWIPGNLFFDEQFASPFRFSVNCVIIDTSPEWNFSFSPVSRSFLHAPRSWFLST